MPSTRLTRRINAPRSRVYRALLDAHAVSTWMVPTGMTSHVHAFDPREGGGTDLLAVHDDLPPSLPHRQRARLAALPREARRPRRGRPGSPMRLKPPGPAHRALSPGARTALVISAVAAAAACATPRAKPLVAPAPLVSPAPLVAPAPYEESTTWTCSTPVGPYRPLFLDGTVTTTFAPGAPAMVAGDKLIQPDEDTRRIIGVAGIEEVTGSLELCSDSDGKPFKITLARSTEYAAYDQTITDEARRWRFVPHQFRDEYIASCTTVQFSYRPRR